MGHPDNIYFPLHKQENPILVSFIFYLRRKFENRFLSPPHMTGQTLKRSPRLCYPLLPWTRFLLRMPRSQPLRGRLQPDSDPAGLWRTISSLPPHRRPARERRPPILQVFSSPGQTNQIFSVYFTRGFQDLFLPWMLSANDAVICLGRPDLKETLQTWPGGRAEQGRTWWVDTALLFQIVLLNSGGYHSSLLNHSDHIICSFHNIF